MRGVVLAAVFMLGCGGAEEARPAALQGVGGSGGTEMAGSGGTGSAMGHDAGEAGTAGSGGFAGIPIFDAGKPKDAGRDTAPEPDTGPPCEGEVGTSIPEMNEATPTRCYHPEGAPGEWCCGGHQDYPVWVEATPCGEEGLAYTAGISTDAQIQLPDGGLVFCDRKTHLSLPEVVRRCCE